MSAAPSAPAQITRLAGAAGAKLRDRSRSVQRRLVEIGRAVRGKAMPNRERRQRASGRLLEATGRVVGQARRFSREIGAGVKRGAEVVDQAVLEGLGQTLDAMIPRGRQVMRQTKSRIFGGEVHSEGKLVSLFEPSAEVIRKSLPPRRRGARSASPPRSASWSSRRRPRTRSSSTTQIVIDYPDRHRLPRSSSTTQSMRAGPPTSTCCYRPSRPIAPGSDARPRLVAGDAAFYSAKNEAAAKAIGVKRVCIPNRATKSAERKREQKKRWFRDGQRWRTGSEGRSSVTKPRPRPLPLSRRRRHAPLGRPRRHRRQPDHPRQRDNRATGKVGSSPSWPAG